MPCGEVVMQILRPSFHFESRLGWQTSVHDSNCFGSDNPRITDHYSLFDSDSIKNVAV